MNERIRELAIQSGLPTALDYHQKRYEKFAELIVRECSQAVLEVPCYYKDYRAQIEEVVINDCARAVLEHFGVDE